MHFVIMGCGRVGASLARTLASMGHSVAIIDRDAEAFRRLPEDFTGQEVTGVGFDRDVLKQAGIEEADGFAAVSSGDNSNIIAARVVRENFGIANVVARIYDPSRADLYERLGVPTVATVKWTADRVLHKLIPLGPHYTYSDAIAEMSLVNVDVDESWFGSSMAQLEDATGARVAYLTRYGAGVLPDEDEVLQDGDGLSLIVPTAHAAAAQHVLMNSKKDSQ
ncbi:potassium channel family protein [Neoactinobaculum massilliense]|uniref:potassium channel family protein n=1 Tax=Neoactinobaculum massilliense TaxID=2364794 RepID=UPI0019CF78DB|nr:TrkA family potassium uptake protein [Neoactinobaculum massilliense]